MKDLNTRIAEKFKDPNFEKEYHRTAALYRLAGRVLLLRKKRGLTQKELAEKMGTTQAVVSRLESASVKPSIETVLNFAEALDSVVDIHLTPIEDTRRKSVPGAKVSWEKLLINIPEVDDLTKENSRQDYNYFEYAYRENDERNINASTQSLALPMKEFGMTK